MKKVALMGILTGDIKSSTELDDIAWESNQVSYEALYWKVHSKAHRVRVKSLREPKKADNGGKKDMELGQTQGGKGQKAPEEEQQGEQQWPESSGYWGINECGWPEWYEQGINAFGKGGGKGTGGKGGKPQWFQPQAWTQPGKAWKGGGKGGKGAEEKGKGKGNPFRGECWNCGRKGHSSAQCPELGKGFSGECHKCGIKGHRASQCPSDDKKLNQVAEGGEDELGQRPDFGSCCMVTDDPPEMCDSDEEKSDTH